MAEENIDIVLMRRALQLARLGEGFVSPNPMVGAVIASADGRIIGEGWHRRFGGPHAEVNAVASVKDEDRKLLKDSTIYVTLEPCSHYGKTPPCAKLLVETGFRRAVVACVDPNPKVAGRGIAMLRDAGMEVEVGLLEQEALELNRRFITAFTSGRPYVQLKWAESSDGFIAAIDSQGNALPVALSSPMAQIWMHRERARADAIMIGSETALIDSPRLTLRHWPGRQPLRVVADRRHRVDIDRLFPDGNAIRFEASEGNLKEALSELRAQHDIGSLMVEGGTRLLDAFLRSGCWDEVRREVSGVRIGNGIKAPKMPLIEAAEREELFDGTLIERFYNIDS